MRTIRYITILAVNCLLFTQCSQEVEVYPTGTYDTLGIRWMTIERDNITYYFQGEGAKAASIYTDLYEDAYDELVPIFSPQLPQKLRYFVWADWELGTARLGHLPGFANSINVVCHVRLNQTLGHEITHILSYWAKGVEPSSYSKFINEGIAVAFDLRGDNKLETAKEALRDYNLQSITDLWVEDTNNIPDDILYPVGGAFVTYLYNKSMHDEFFALTKRQTLQDARIIYGEEQMNNFIADFNSQLEL